jgi:hypothetical protein
MGSAININEPSVEARLLNLLADVWPNTANVGPAHLGLSGRGGGLTFLDAIEELSDGGLLGYEALMIDIYGPRIHQASITPRGRALLRCGYASELDPGQADAVPSSPDELTSGMIR